MTITLKPAAVLALVALIGILVGFSISQVSVADSSPTQRSAADTRLLRSIDNRLNRLDSFGGTLYKINKNVYESCRETGAIGCRL